MKKVYFASAYLDKYPLSVEGESKYQSNIEYAAGYFDDGKKKFREDGYSAELILEDSNPYDPGNAVRVDMDGATVGYLAMHNAAKYRKALQKLGLSDVIGVCGAAIFGRREDEDEGMNFGVWLDLDLKDLKVNSEKEIKPASPPVIQEPATQPRKISSKAAVVVEQPAPKITLKKIFDFTRWAFAPGRWWKTLLLIFFAFPFLCGILQGIAKIILGQ
jgi:hypothetical protein